MQDSDVPQSDLLEKTVETDEEQSENIQTVLIKAQSHYFGDEEDAACGLKAEPVAEKLSKAVKKTAKGLNKE